MNSEIEKKGLLLEMIAFSTVDGELHKREYEFLWIVAQELKINKDVFLDLFHQESYPSILKSEFQRIQQFYRLALIMYCDGVLHERESQGIQQIALGMGLNPGAVKRILGLMKNAPNAIIDPKILLKVFQEQHN